MDNQDNVAIVIKSRRGLGQMQLLENIMVNFFSYIEEMKLEQHLDMY